jgi:hypothetical protein
MVKTMILAATFALTSAAAAFAGSPSTAVSGDAGSHGLSLAMNGSSAVYSSVPATVPLTASYADPHVAGATGRTIVIGDSSTIAGDRMATQDQRTGTFDAD